MTDSEEDTMESEDTTETEDVIEVEENAAEAEI